MTLTIVVGYAQVDFKLPPITAVFLLTKLFFTCVAEEAIFRGYLQERLSRLFLTIRFSGFMTVFFSGLLFGLAHAGGGFIYTSLAALAGIGYAYAYLCTKRIEAPILTHFALITVHFIGFTYPHVR